MGYVAPAMLVLIFLLVIPLFYTLYCSLYNLDYLVKGDFVGLGNYLRLLKDVRISKSLLFTFEITIISTLLSVGIGLLLALWVDREHGLFAYLIEMFGLIPWVISMMVAALLWRWLFNGDLGLFNMILKALGHNPIYVVENKNSAIIALIFVLTWRLVGYAMIMILAGLKSLDPVLLEAAKVDGANRLQRIWHITLPGIKPTVVVLLIMGIGGALNVGMERQMLLSNPLVEDHTMVLSWFSYKRGIGNSNYGLGTAIGVFQSAVSVTLLLIANKIAGLVGEDKLM